MCCLSAKSQADYTVGSATANSSPTGYPCPIQDFYEGSRMQFLYLASELQSAGISAGFINSIKFNAVSITTQTATNFTAIEQLNISIGTTSSSSLDNTIWETGTTSVFGPIDYTVAVGVNEFLFTTPFLWNGTDNIVIDVCNGDPNNGTYTAWTNNAVFPITTGLTFNGSHTYRLDNGGNKCSQADIADNGLGLLTSRPDITFNWSSPVACSGSPVAGITASSKDSVCANIPFNLFTTGSTVGTGLTYQWQDSVPGGSWANISGATKFSYNVAAGITSAKYYRRKITCSGFTTISAPKWIYVRPFYECYCGPFVNTNLHSNSVTPTIESVAIVGGTLSFLNASPGSNTSPIGYSYFTDTVPNATPASIPILKQSTSYTMTLEASATPATNAAGYWIDWNHNAIYDSAEYVNIPFITGSLTADIVIDVPENATLGLTMMRIRTRNFGMTYADACTSFTNGETEDYIFRVAPGISCSGTPLGGEAQSSVISACPNVPFILSIINSTSGVTNLSYQWQDSSSAHTWQDINSAKGKTLNISGITTATCYRRKITCGNSSLSSYSQPVCVTMNQIFDCYCSPFNGTSLHSSTGPTIENIDITGGSTLYSNAHPGAEPAPNLGYVKFTDTSLAPCLTQAVPHILTVTTSAAPNQAAVWIDWDHSGTFETSERQAIVFTGTSGVVTITPPTTVPLGFTMMRVRVRAATFTLACEQFGSGETEDYVIKVCPGTSCTGSPLPGAAAASTATACNGLSFIVSVTGATDGVIGLKYQWQDSIVGGNWTDIAGKTGEADTTIQSAARYYRRKITCTPSGISTYSTPVFVDQLLVTYATLPFTEDFENTWEDGCGDAGSRTIPNNSWRNSPLMKDSSWRRNDDGVSANWILPNSGLYSPVSSTGSYSARFHTYEATFGTSGNLDLFINCQGGISPLKRFNYDFINTTGTDSVQIFLSTDGGLTFTKIDTFHTAAAWTTRTIDFTSNSATTVIRFKATSEFGTTDIGIDNLSIISIIATDLSVTAMTSPASTLTVTNAGTIAMTITNTGGAAINFASNHAYIGARVLNPSGVTTFYRDSIITGTLASGASQSATITTTANFSQIGNYFVRCGSGINGDGNSSNDSSAITPFVANSPVIYAIANGNWGDGATWSTGTVPTAADTVTIAGFTVNLGGVIPSPYACSSLGIGKLGSLLAPTGTVLTLGNSVGSNKALTVAPTATINISGGSINHNGFIQFSDSANLVMSSGNLNIDGNNGTDAGSVPAGVDLLSFGTAAKPYSFGNINLTGGTITIVDPHRFNGVAIAYRGTVAKNISAGNTITLGNGVSNHTSSVGTGGFIINTLLSSSRLSLGSLVINGGNTVPNRFTTFAVNLGINGDLTVNANSELRSALTAYLGGNVTNNGIMACTNPVNFQSYINGTAAPVTVGQTISGNGIYRNNVPTSTVVSTGSGYSVGDVLTLNGGVNTTPATVYVLSVGGTGSIISSVLFNMGNYTTAPTGTLTVTGGSGTGATFTATNLVTLAKFSGLTFNNTSAAGITISSLGTSLPSQLGTISGTGVLTMTAGIINNGNNVIILGNSVAQRGNLNYTSGVITGKLRRWFTTANNTGATGDFPVGKGSFARNARIEFTTAPTKGGTLTTEFIASAAGTGGLPINDGISLTNISDDGYWRIEVDSIVGGNYTVSLTDSGITGVQTLSSLRSVKRAVGSVNWSIDGTPGTNTGSITKPVVVRTGLAGFASEYAIAGATDNTLPYTSLKFTGEKVGNSNQLKWIVLNEIDVKAYELQKSLDGVNFNTITSVSSKTISAINPKLDYGFTDNNSISNDGYYRLKQIAKDGSVLYSNIVLIKGLKISGLVVGNIFPNPVKSSLNVMIATSSNKLINISITDMNGKQVIRANRSINQGDNNLSFNLEKLAVGTYTISVTDTNGNKSNFVNFVKQ